MISPDHPLVSITVTRAPAAATASLGSEPFYPVLELLLSAPRPSLRSTRPARHGSRRGVRKPARDISHRAGLCRGFIRFYYYYAYRHARAARSALWNLAGILLNPELSISQGSPRDDTGSLARLFRPPVPLDFDLVGNIVSISP